MGSLITYPSVWTAKELSDSSYDRPACRVSLAATCVDVWADQSNVLNLDLIRGPAVLSEGKLEALINDGLDLLAFLSACSAVELGFAVSMSEDPGIDVRYVGAILGRDW